MRARLLLGAEVLPTLGSQAVACRPLGALLGASVSIAQVKLPSLPCRSSALLSHGLRSGAAKSALFLFFKPQSWKNWSVYSDRNQFTQRTRFLASSGNQWDTAPWSLKGPRFSGSPPACVASPSFLTSLPSPPSLPVLQQALTTLPMLQTLC